MSQEKGKLAVISGFSGVGKGTLVQRLIQQYPYDLSVSATTRLPRPGEEPGVSYFYISREEFEARIEREEFLEWARYVDHYYGTPKPFVMEQLAKGKNVILEIESEGAFQVKKRYPEAQLIFILPPSMQELERRLTERGTEESQVIRKRLLKACEEEMPKIEQYDFWVVNDDLASCTEELHQLIQTGKTVRPRDPDLPAKLKAEAAIIFAGNLEQSGV